MEWARADEGAGDGAGGGVRLAPGVAVPMGVVRFAFSRSAGPGGQNVNKVASKAELRVAVGALPMSARARARLVRLAGRRVTEEGELVIVSESERSQGRNRAECLEKLRGLLVEAMAEPKVRRRTRPTRGSRERRLEAKRVRGQIKRRRGGGGGEE